MDGKEFPGTLKKRKKEHRFNVIDGILILIIIAAASALVYILAGNNLFAGGKKTDILYTIEIQLLKNEFVSAVNKMPGTKITDSVRGYDIGEIQSVKVDAASINSDNPTKGVVEQEPYPDYSKITITVKAQSVKGPGGYSVNGKIIMVGEMVDFRTPYFVSYGNCTSVKEITGTGG